MVEECLMDIQNTNRNLVMAKQESDSKLQQELEHLQILVDAMTIPLWQFGEGHQNKPKTPTTRIVLPVRGGQTTRDSEQTNNEQDVNSTSSCSIDATVEEEREGELSMKEDELKKFQEALVTKEEELKKFEGHLNQRENDLEIQLEDLQMKEAELQLLKEKI